MASRSFIINKVIVVYENFPEEIVVINLSTGVYYSLRNMAKAVWECFENRHISIDEIINLFNKNSQDNPKELTEAIHSFIEELLAEELIVSSTHTISNNKEMDINLIKSGTYDLNTLKLDKYTDMKDLLLLDPIHDISSAGWPNAKNKS